MEEKQEYPEYFYLNADHTILCSVDNESTREQFGDLTQINEEAAKSLYHTSEETEDAKGWKKLVSTYPLLDEAVEKKWVKVIPRATEAFQFILRAVKFKDIVLGSAADEVLFSDKFKAAKEAFLAGRSEQDSEFKGEGWYTLGNAYISSFMQIYRAQHPERTDLEEPI